MLYCVGFTDDAVQNFVVITWPRSLEDHIGAFTIAALRNFKNRKSGEALPFLFWSYFEDARIAHYKVGCFGGALTTVAFRFNWGSENRVLQSRTIAFGFNLSAFPLKIVEVLL